MGCSSSRSWVTLRGASVHWIEIGISKPGLPLTLLLLSSLPPLELFLFIAKFMKYSTEGETQVRFVSDLPNCISVFCSTVLRRSLSNCLKVFPLPVDVGFTTWHTDPSNYIHHQQHLKFHQISFQKAQSFTLTWWLIILWLDPASHKVIDCLVSPSPEPMLW